ncbi:hypothetical protein OEZ85_005033 [Tetradesmus obliquus]|uniref:Uncharacterized protein n=1 Tax=Tetradesmus obliquus TaxID=3088 RepID=A0ABY8UK32_TETOB|nr:hypothetical protein OEZ85_005033 [Tetradesmus obliquus]
MHYNAAGVLYISECLVPCSTQKGSCSDRPQAGSTGALCKRKMETNQGNRKLNAPKHLQLPPAKIRSSNQTGHHSNSSRRKEVLLQLLLKGGALLGVLGAVALVGAGVYVFARKAIK